MVVHHSCFMSCLVALSGMSVIVIACACGHVSAWRPLVY